MSLLDPADEAMIREAIGPAKEASNVEIPWDSICLIRELYATRRFTQAELARCFGMSKGYMSRIVNGHVRKTQYACNTVEQYSWLLTED
jgi:predicted XRE-type DNA-binding protein